MPVERAHDRLDEVLVHFVHELPDGLLGLRRRRVGRDRGGRGARRAAAQGRRGEGRAHHGRAVRGGGGGGGGQLGRLVQQDEAHAGAGQEGGDVGRHGRVGVDVFEVPIMFIEHSS